MAGIGAFAPAQVCAECPLPGQADPPNKDRHGSKNQLFGAGRRMTALGANSDLLRCWLSEATLSKVAPNK